ncbi:MAG: class I SAM-dependent methyltransferase, partial [Candidatus Acidiferrales bacterium]
MAATPDIVGYWESIAERRLGRYITGVQRQVLELGMVRRPAPETAFEIGCGGGRWSRILASKGYSVICADVDSASLEECHRRIPDAHCILTSPDQRILPCDSESVGLLFCFEVEPVTVADWFPREAARVMKPGAVLVASFLNCASIRGLAHRMLGHSSGEEAFYRRSYVSCRKQLRAA